MKKEEEGRKEESRRREVSARGGMNCEAVAVIEVEFSDEEKGGAPLGV